MLKPGVDFDKVSFFILGTNKNDKACMPHVLTPPIMQSLYDHLPDSCLQSNFWLKYSLIRDGASIKSLEMKSGLAQHTVMAIETLHGDVFGCFMSKPWLKNNQYRHVGESFLWQMNGHRKIEESDVDVFPWTGENNLCQLFRKDKIACGRVVSFLKATF